MENSLPQSQASVEHGAMFLVQNEEPWWMAGWSKHVSPSALGRISACVRSEAMPHVRDNTPFAQKGTVAHKFLADCLDHGREKALSMVEDAEDVSWLASIDLERLPAFEREAYESEVAIAYDPRTRTARKVGQNISREEARRRAEDHEIVGIIDVLGMTDDQAVAHDYKTGWGYVEPAEVNWQLRTYALFAARWLKRESAVYSVIRVRDNMTPWFDAAAMDELDLMAHEDALLALLAERDEVRSRARAGEWEKLPPLTEGKHCRYCPAMWVCPAKTHAIRIINTPLEDVRVMEGPLTVEQAAKAWQEVRSKRRSLERQEAILKDLARQTPLPLGEGEVLGERETVKESIVPEKAREVLESQWGPLGAAVIGDAMKTETSVAWNALKSALKRLVLPTLPKPDQKISWLERDARKLLRDNGAVTVRVEKTVTEWVPKVEAPEEAA